MSLDEQALLLLDIHPSKLRRLNPENFSSLDQTIVESLPGTPAVAEAAPPAPPEANPFAVASRMSRPHYEDQARAEALTQALRRIRASNANRNHARPATTRSPAR